MATFTFETITAAQALAFTASDRLAFGTGTAVQSSVAYLGNGDVSITVGGLSVEFSAAVSAVGFPFQFQSDSSQLWVGGAGVDSVTFGGLLPGAANAVFGGGSDDALDLGVFGGLAQGNQGNDSLSSSGQATLYGGQGNDSITTQGGAHDDFLQANKGDDVIHYAGAHDTALGGQGNDSISGPAGLGAFLDGNLGNDTISGSGQLFGEGGDDTLVSAGSGHDTLSGGDGDDSLIATTGANALAGDAGDDTISITGGAQVISGGAGADKFVFGAGTTTPGTVPQITDWNGAEDKISFLGFTPNPSDFTSVSANDYASAVTMATNLTTQNHFSFVAVQVGPDVILFAGSSGGLSAAVDLVGRSLADFTPGHNLV